MRCDIKQGIEKEGRKLAVGRLRSSTVLRNSLPRRARLHYDMQKAEAGPKQLASRSTTAVATALYYYRLRSN